MSEREFQGPKERLPGDGEEPEEDLAGLTVEEIIGTPGGNLLFAQSPLAPSRPGCAGDLGTVAGVRVVDVVEEPTGLLHVMAGVVPVGTGAKVPIWRDPERRDRLGATLAATIACQAALAQLEVPVAAIEVVAGMAWLDLDGRAPPLDLRPFAERDEPIEILARTGDRMTVYLGGRAIETVRGPVAASTAAIGGAEVRPVAAVDPGHEALEVALPDREGVAWWR